MVRIYCCFWPKKVISAILEVFFGNDLPLFLAIKISKKQNCVCCRNCFLILSQNELLSKKTFLDSKSITLLDIKIYHYDVFMTNTMGIMKASKTSTKYRFLWCNLSFSLTFDPTWTNKTIKKVYFLITQFERFCNQDFFLHHAMLVEFYLNLQMFLHARGQYPFHELIPHLQQINLIFQNEALFHYGFFQFFVVYLN